MLSMHFLGVSPNQQANVNHSAPRFGCRLFGFMSVEPDQKQAQILQDLFERSKNSLMDQAQATPDSDLAPRNYETIIAGSILNDHHITARQDEGCGEVRFEEGKPPVLYKTLHGLHKDTKIREEVRQFDKNLPTAWMLHLREAFSSVAKPKIDLKDSHPFTLGNFAFMHNGTLSPAAVHWLNRQVERYHQRFPNEIPKPQSQTDSERVFLYMMGRLREKCGTLDHEKISTPQLEAVFQETLQRLDWLNQRQQGNQLVLKIGPYLKNSTGLDVQDPSRYRFLYGMNFFLSDGNRILLSRSNRPIHITGIPDENGRAKAVLISSYPIQPQEDTKTFLKWWNLPNNHYCVVERNNNRKTIEYRMDSFYQKDTPDMRQWKAAMKVRSTIERVGQLFTSSEKAKG